MVDLDQKIKGNRSKLSNGNRPWLKIIKLIASILLFVLIKIRLAPR